MIEHLKPTVCCYSILFEADIGTMCHHIHNCDIDCMKCQIAAIDCHLISSSTLSLAAKVVSTDLLLSLPCPLLGALGRPFEPTLLMNMVGTVRRPKQRRQAAPRGGHIADDAAAMEYEAYEDAAYQPMVCTLCSLEHKLLNNNGIYAVR